MTILRLLGWRKSEEEGRDELLSAYVDGELSEREREHLETRLSQEPALRAEFRALQQTVSMVRELPQARAPRNFILTESMVASRESAPAPEPQGTWAAPLLTAATTVVSLLFVVVLVGDLVLSGAGGMASAPQPMRQAEEAAPMALEITSTREGEDVPGEDATPFPAASPEAPEMAVEGESDQTETEAAEALPETEETPVLGASSEAPREPATEAEEEPNITDEMSAAGTTPPAADGGPTEEALTLVVPTTAPTVTEKSVLTPTIPAEEPVVSEEELGVLEPTPAELEGAPLPVREEDRLSFRRLPWRTLEITLGLVASVLAFATILAWRAQRS